MRLNSFDLGEPVPELNQPHALAIIRPWTDVSGVGSLVLSCLETYLDAKELGELARPGDFFDFTRYRPTLIRQENNSEVVVPDHPQEASWDVFRDPYIYPDIDI
jgi:hypothetical protein